ncbi:hypothetical protein [Radiobacillus sp. PE A8.2]|uniref:hypothetical protein n=1 Tax=Radiobacillus sp. PE A8.2 TaxID=3380349 RepID=UPI00388DF13F
MRSVQEEFKTISKLILHVLEEYPETRNSDNKLFIQCAKELGAESLEELEDSKKLNMISVHKERQRIQNKLGLWKADDEVQGYRNQRENEIRDYMKQAN